VQVITGLFLAMYYDPSILYAFSSIMYINSEIYYVDELGAYMRMGRHFFFMCIYTHV